ncbi:MAG: BamA/TamA family outer membrane protein [Rubellimicrobium sp.]|nr:BamA/TamA family outer membrane protein [Rubellimicrobium sp.]
MAQEVTLDLTTGDEALAQILRANSLVVSLEGGADRDAVEYVAAARADYRRLLTALYAAGHYGGTVSILIDGREAAGIAPLDAPAAVARVEITVDPGPRFTFGAVGIGPLAPGTALPPGLTQGEVARSTLIEAGAQAAVAGWRAQGHALAQVAGQDIRAFHGADRLDVALRLAPGPALTFGPLSVSGNEAVRSDRIRAIAGLPEGARFDPAAIARAQERLRRTGAFASVALIEGEAPGPGSTLPVTAQVQEMVPRRLGFGAEVSTTEGLSLNAFWLHRNLLGGAERLRLDAAVTGIEGGFGLGGRGGPDLALGLSFGRPATLSPDMDLTAALALERLDEADYLLSQITGNVGLLRHARDGLTWEAGLGLIAAQETTPWRARSYALVTLPLRATLERRDDPLDATSGYFLDVTATPFLGAARPDSGLRLMADGRFYHRFGGADGRVTLALRAQAGSVLGADLLAAPRDFLFHSGGGGTVRGQPYQDLGIAITRDFGTGPQTVRIGGRSFAGLQSEARIRVTESIGAVGFLDLGAIDLADFPGEGAEWHAGAGIGLRYDTAIGPIRLDLATPVSGDNALGAVQIYIGIGQAF